MRQCRMLVSGQPDRAVAIAWDRRGERNEMNSDGGQASELFRKDGDAESGSDIVQDRDGLSGFLHNVWLKPRALAENDQPGIVKQGAGAISQEEALVRQRGKRDLCWRFSPWDRGMALGPGHPLCAVAPLRAFFSLDQGMSMGQNNREFFLRHGGELEMGCFCGETKPDQAEIERAGFQGLDLPGGIHFRQSQFDIGD